MREISLSISKSKDITELQILISELKVRINAYGIAYNSIFADSHIWEQISIIGSKEKKMESFAGLEGKIKIR